jgi:hypothetical protein
VVSYDAFFVGEGHTGGADPAKRGFKWLEEFVSTRDGLIVVPAKDSLGGALSWRSPTQVPRTHTKYPLDSLGIRHYEYVTERTSPPPGGRAALC